MDVPIDEIEFSYARSSGPGGQNVNKVNSKAILHWSISTSSSLPQDVKSRFLSKYARRITSDGYLVLTSQRYRDQARNISDCLDKLSAMLTSVCTPPKKRKRTQPSQASKRKRLEEKRSHSKKKLSRRVVAVED